MSNIDKEKAVAVALAQIEKSYGKGSVMKLGQRPNVDIEAVSTGSLGLDIALGIIRIKLSCKLPLLQ